MMRRARAIGLLVLFAAGLGALWWLPRQGHPASGPVGDPSKRIAAPQAVHAPPSAFAPGEPPRLLPARPDGSERPPLAWERLLAADGSPAEDVAALNDLVSGYLQAGTGDARRAIGFNEDLGPALTDAEALGDAALPADHPAVRDGKLIDRWGTPWQVHPLAADKIELRSAGPDRRLYTADDLLIPRER